MFSEFLLELFSQQTQDSHALARIFPGVGVGGPQLKNQEQIIDVGVTGRASAKDPH